MGSWHRMGAFLGLVAEDDADDDEYGYPSAADETPYEPTYTRLPSRRRVTTGGERPGGGAPMVDGALAVQLRPEPPHVTESATASRPLTVKLTGFGEARIIGERYRDGTSVILDMTDLTDNDARRVVDFAAGLAFALRGSIDKVTARVFMLLPPDADMSAADRRAFAGSYVHR